MCANSKSGVQCSQSAPNVRPDPSWSRCLAGPRRPPRLAHARTCDRLEDHVARILWRHAYRLPSLANVGQVVALRADAPLAEHRLLKRLPVDRAKGPHQTLGALADGVPQRAALPGTRGVVQPHRHEAISIRAVEEAQPAHRLPPGGQLRALRRPSAAEPPLSPTDVLVLPERSAGPRARPLACPRTCSCCQAARIRHTPTRWSWKVPHLCQMRHASD